MTIKDNCTPPSRKELDLRPVEGSKADLEMAALAKAMGHPIRVKILRFLSKKNDCMCADIVSEIQIPQSSTSQHLKVLKESGLITGTISGASTCYCIDQNVLRRARLLISSL